MGALTLARRRGRREEAFFRDGTRQVHTHPPTRPAPSRIHTSLGGVQTHPRPVPHLSFVCNLPREYFHNPGQVMLAIPNHLAAAKRNASQHGRAMAAPLVTMSFRCTTSTICRSGASSVSITPEPACSHTRSYQPRKSHRAAVCPRLLEPRCLPSNFSIRHGHPMKRQRGWNPFSQDALSASIMQTYGFHDGPGQRRYLSRKPIPPQQPSQEQHTPPRYIDLFAGIGATHSVLKKNGLKCVYANEPDQGSWRTFMRNNTLDSPDLYPDSRDIRQVPLPDIPSHTLLAAWLPIGSRPTRYENCRSLFARILQIVEAKRPPVVMIGGAQPNSSEPGNHANSTRVKALIYKRIVELTQELEAIGYWSTFALYNNADFDLPVVRHNIFCH